MSDTTKQITGHLDNIARLLSEVDTDNASTGTIATLRELDQEAELVRVKGAAIRAAVFVDLIDSGKFTQRTLAKELGISDNTVSKIYRAGKAAQAAGE